MKQLGNVSCTGVRMVDPSICAGLRAKRFSSFKIAVVVSASALALSACTSTGFSDFEEGLSAQTTNSDTQVYAAASNSGVVEASGTRDGSAPVTLGGVKPANTGETFSTPVAEPVEETTTVAAVSPANNSGQITQSGDTQFSVPTPEIRETAYAPDSLDGEPELSPEELEAQKTLARIEKLYGEIEHGKCKGGWGTQAKKLDALRYNPGDPYYIEIRMRHTPPLPVGHTYTAYGRLDENGRKLDEHLVMLAPVGGYAGATVAATVPVTGVMTPSKTDCLMQPTAAYRVSLSAEQYEALLAEIKQAKIDKPKYALWTYNCNHFTSRISQSVGIRAPQNKYTASVVYMYDLMAENEGANYSPNSNFLAQVNSSRRARLR